MAISTSLTESPTNPQRSDPDNFRVDADAYVNWHTQDFVPEMNTVIDDLNATIQNLFVGTSTTSNTVGTGSKTWTMVEDNLAFGVGNNLRIADTADPTSNFMEGIITAYNKTTKELTVTVDSSTGSGTITAWTMTLAPPVDFNRVRTYSSMTGAAAAPIVAIDNSIYYVLITDTADVTADVPGVSAKWLRISGVTYEEITSSKDWDKPAGAKWVLIHVGSAAGGGGGGSNGDGDPVDRSGGGGGGGGGLLWRLLPASDVASTVSVVVGGGGAGGAAAATSDTASVVNGTMGTVGGNSSFGDIVVQGGAAGRGGNFQTAQGGIGGGIFPAAANGDATGFRGGGTLGTAEFGGAGGGHSWEQAGTGTITGGGCSNFGGAGGGGGVGRSSTVVYERWYGGTRNLTILVGNYSISPAAGGNGVNEGDAGSGGDVGQAGGNGALMGGGGGGGYNVHPAASGAGGAGGDGVVRVWTW